MAAVCASLPKKPELEVLAGLSLFAIDVYALSAGAVLTGGFVVVGAGAI
jgi:hypothetical protein